MLVANLKQFLLRLAIKAKFGEYNMQDLLLSGPSHLESYLWLLETKKVRWVFYIVNWATKNKEVGG